MKRRASVGTHRFDGLQTTTAGRSTRHPDRLPQDVWISRAMLTHPIFEATPAFDFTLPTSLIELTSTANAQHADAMAFEASNPIAKRLNRIVLSANSVPHESTAPCTLDANLRRPFEHKLINLARQLSLDISLALILAYFPHLFQPRGGQNCGRRPK